MSKYGPQKISFFLQKSGGLENYAAHVNRKNKCSDENSNFSSQDMKPNTLHN